MISNFRLQHINALLELISITYLKVETHLIISKDETE